MAVTRQLLQRAGRLPDGGLLLRTADALHVATALESEAADFCTYDRRQAGVATVFGFRIVAPGRPADWY